MARANEVARGVDTGETSWFHDRFLGLGVNASTSRRISIGSDIAQFFVCPSYTGSGVPHEQYTSHKSRLSKSVYVMIIPLGVSHSCQRTKITPLSRGTVNSPNLVNLDWGSLPVYANQVNERSRRSSWGAVYFTVCSYFHPLFMWHGAIGAVFLSKSI